MKQFESHINGAIPVVVDFYAEWCGPCKLMAPVLQELKRSVGERAVVLKMDIDKNQQFAQRYAIQSVPTLMIFKEGHIAWRKSGLTTASEILEQLKLIMS